MARRTNPQKGGGNAIADRQQPTWPSLHNIRRGIPSGRIGGGTKSTAGAIAQSRWLSAKSVQRTTRILNHHIFVQQFGLLPFLRTF